MLPFLNEQRVDLRSLARRRRIYGNRWTVLPLKLIAGRRKTKSHFKLTDRLSTKEVHGNGFLFCRFPKYHSQISILFSKYVFKTINSEFLKQSLSTTEVESCIVRSKVFYIVTNSFSETVTYDNDFSAYLRASWNLHCMQIQTQYVLRKFYSHHICLWLSGKLLWVTLIENFNIVGSLWK